MKSETFFARMPAASPQRVPTRPQPWHVALALPHFPAQAVLAAAAADRMQAAGLTDQRRGDALPLGVAPGAGGAGKVKPTVRIASGDSWRPDAPQGAQDAVFAVVDQNPDSHKTRLLAVSPGARVAGLAPGMPLYLARRTVPGLRVVRRNRDAERHLLERAAALLEGHTPVHTVRSEGLIFAELTGTPLARGGEPAHWLETLREGLRGLGLQRVTAAAAPSRVLAHLLLLRTREDGARVCAPGEEGAWLPSVPTARLPGLSPAARARLLKYGLVTMGQVAALERGALIDRFGAGEGERLYGWCRGLDAGEPRRVEVPRAETVLERDLNDEEGLRAEARLLADRLGHMLRGRNARALSLRLSVTYADRKQARGTAKLEAPTQAFEPLARAAESLLRDLYARRVSLRRLCLEAVRLGRHDGQQDLFHDADRRKQEALGEAIERIRRKRSFGDIVNAVNRVGETEMGGRAGWVGKPMPGPAPGSRRGSGNLRKA